MTTKKWTADQICEIIRRKREKLKITRATLADRAGISLKQVENIEENRYKVLGDIFALLATLEIGLTLTDGTVKVKCIKKETCVPELDLPQCGGELDTNDAVDKGLTFSDAPIRSGVEENHNFLGSRGVAADEKESFKKTLDEIKNRIFGTFQAMSECTGVPVNSLNNLKRNGHHFCKYRDALMIFHSKLDKFSWDEIQKFRNVVNRHERWVKFQNMIYSK